MTTCSVDQRSSARSRTNRCPASEAGAGGDGIGSCRGVRQPRSGEPGEIDVAGVVVVAQRTGPRALLTDETAEVDEVEFHEDLDRVMSASSCPTMAEDRAQEAVVRAWRHQIDTGEHLRSLEAWTVRTALNLCRSQHRRDGAEARALRRTRAPTR